ncbi:MAG: ribosome recycling factor [Candidatus Taylorbacteria bacterium CG11_big_fil_rev_8_21_14_0_20_46_11]|uniref:Ribosome recycling factor n=1 Tax=Candidatus Taylorbacteria bacterium CG11_big_fil_rev_8_21_14_0_20_46_11 TaxID=1975025 RepID=A0A2H0KDN2_9BACT|nr:MAG: ribosome recycling factor [Candidatus Taylorbacteria bacterium CG11_big_fil_rev_8_21_14_0_20_46_11]
MAYAFTLFTTRAQEIDEWITRELSGLRSGRATPAVLDNVFVESYGAKMPIKHVATISLEGARTLRIIPFDPSIGKEIEKAIVQANVGLTASSDDGGVRAHFPELTSERRDALIKVAREKLEAARINVRKLRDEVIKDIEATEKEGGMGEDEKFRLKKELEKMSEAENTKLQEAFDRKEKEIAS